MANQITSYGLNNLAQSLNTVYQTLVESDGGLLAFIGQEAPATQMEHRWFDDSIAIQETSGTVSGNVITVPSGDALSIEVGDNLYSQTNGKGFVVASKVAGALTVTALDGAATPVSGFYNIFIPSNIEGSETRRNIKHQATKKNNYTEIFERGVKISNTALASKSEDASTQIATQTNAAVVDIKNRVQQALYSGYPEDGDASTARHFGGLDYFVTNGKAINGALTYKAINNAIRATRKKGGRPNFIVMNPVHSEEMNKILYENQRSTIGETRIGVNARLFIDPISGQTIQLIYDSQCPKGVLYLGELNKLGLAYLRPLTVEPLGKVGDNTALSIIQELTLVVRNAGNCFYKLSGLTWED